MANYKNTNVNIHTKVVDTTINTIKHISLIEAGFEYVTEMNGIKLFRKRK